jgi:hypothetical protein
VASKRRPATREPHGLKPILRDLSVLSPFFVSFGYGFWPWPTTGPSWWSRFVRNKANFRELQVGSGKFQANKDRRRVLRVFPLREETPCGLRRAQSSRVTTNTAAPCETKPISGPPGRQPGTCCAKQSQFRRRAQGTGDPRQAHDAKQSQSSRQQFWSSAGTVLDLRARGNWIGQSCSGTELPCEHPPARRQ